MVGQAFGSFGEDIELSQGFRTCLAPARPYDQHGGIYGAATAFRANMTSTFFSEESEIRSIGPRIKLCKTFVEKKMIVMITIGLAKFTSDSDCHCFVERGRRSSGDRHSMAQKSIR